MILPFEEYCVLIELIADYEDLKDLQQTKAESQYNKPIALDEVILKLGL